MTTIWKKCINRWDLPWEQREDSRTCVGLAEGTSALSVSLSETPLVGLQALWWARALRIKKALGIVGNLLRQEKMRDFNSGDIIMFTFLASLI